MRTASNQTADGIVPAWHETRMPLRPTMSVLTVHNEIYHSLACDRYLRLFVLAMIAILSPRPLPVVAQSSSGRITGTVRDKHGSQALSGVRVSIRSPGATDSAQSATDDSGRFALLALPPDDYELTFSLPGYHDCIVKSVRVQSERASSVDVELDRGGAGDQAAIVLNWGREPLNRWGTAQGTVFERPRIENLPAP